MSETNSGRESEPKQEGDFEGDIKERENWFSFQRTYPFGAIPPNARERAWLTRPITSPESPKAITSLPYWNSLGPANTQANLVAEIGTTSGRINSIAVSPTNNQLILVGASTGGIWRSTDGGANFTPVSDTQVDLAVGSIAFAPSNTSVVYSGMGDGQADYLGTGVLKSTDAGQTWIRVSDNSLPAPGRIMKVAVDPTNPDRLYVAQSKELGGDPNQEVDSGFYLSTDGGVTWTRTLVGNARDLAINSGNSQNVYAAMRTATGGAGIYLSTDGGVSFASSSRIYPYPFPTIIDIRVATTAADSQRVYVYSGTTGSLRLAVSTDGGATFPIANARNLIGSVDDGQLGYNTYLAADPNNANTVYIGSRDVFRTNDSGSTWSNLTSAWAYQCSPLPCTWNYTPFSSSAHSDQHSIAFSPTNANVLYIGSDGGLQKSTNGGATFQSLNQTLAITQFIGYALHPTDQTISYGGTQDNGAEKRDISSGPIAWTEFSNGDGGQVVINAALTSMVFTTYVQDSLQRWTNNATGTGTGIGVVYDANGNLVRDPFGEATSKRLNFYPPFTGNGVDSALYFGTWKLFVCTNCGNAAQIPNWTAPGGTTDLTTGGTDKLSAIGVGHQAYGSNNQEIYTGSNLGQVMVSTDDGLTWTPRTDGLPARYVTSITVDQINSARAYLTVSGFQSGHIFKTVDFGEHWTNISANLPDIPANCFVIDATASNTFYLGTDIGVFRSTDAGSSWSSFNNGLPPVVVHKFGTQSNGNIHVATYGRGVYELVSQFDIGGVVKRDNGVVIEGVTMTLIGGAGGATTTDASGNYAFTNIRGGVSYSVTPSKPGYTFAPVTQSISPLSSDTTLADFVGTPPAAVAYTFVGTGCNPQGDANAWDNPCNWSPQSVPTANDTVTTGDHIINAGNVTVKGLTFNGGALNSGTITVTDAATWSSGTLYATLRIGSAATLAIIGGDETISGFSPFGGATSGILENHGTVNWMSTGRINCDSGGFANNVYRGSIVNTGTFVAQNDQSFTFSGSQGYFVNSGTLRKTTGSGATTFNGVILRNSGTLDVQTGAISLNTDANELNDGTQIIGAGRVRLDAHRTITTGTISGNGTFESGGSPNTGAALEGTATFGGTLTFNWTGGTIVGVPTIGQSATLLISGPDDKTITGFYVIDGTVGQGRLINGGTAIWTGSGRIVSNFGGFTNNSYSGSIINNSTFRAENDSSLILAPGSTTVGYFVNNGVFNKVAGSGTTTVNIPFNNDGTLAVQIGSVALGRGGNSHGNFNPTADTSINFTGFIHSIFNGAMFTGGGRSRVSGGSVSFEFATATVAGGSAFEIATGGELTGVGGFGGSGTVNWTGGLISGATTIGPSATLLISGAADKVITGLNSGGDGSKQGRLTNTGTVIWTGAGRVFFDWGGPENGYHGSIVNNGIFRAENDSNFLVSGGSLGAFVNNGTFMKSSSIGTTTIIVSFVQSGTITLSSGILNLNQAFNPTASSILNLSVGGTTPGTGFAQLNTGSSATLDGALNVNLVNDFSPAIGSNFPLVLYGSHTGTFSQINTPNINWRTFSTLYNSGSVTLQVGAPTTYTVPTPIGTGVRVTGGGVALVFDNVTGSTSPQGGKTPLTGITTITPIDPNSAGPPPSGFIITQDSIAYEITTTATYTGTIRVDIPLTTNLQSIRPQLGLLHGESGSLVDRTIATNSLTTISARVTSLSPFVVAQTVGCVTSLEPTGQASGSAAVQSFTGNGGPGSITVNSPVDCNWTAATSDSWITITSGSGGTGSGTVSYSVAVNSGSTIRSGSIVISGQRFTMLQGINFADVPSTDVFYEVIGKLSAHGVTIGCGGGNYCANDPVTREQMAAFIIRSLGDFNPPVPATQRFSDVPPANPFYAFIDELAARQITLGCGGGNYCPSSPVLREQMAAFLIRGLGEFNPPTPATQRFTDVAPQNIFYNFIDRMGVLQITLGCTPDHSQYCPASPVTRAQMAAFLVRAFKL